MTRVMRDGACYTPMTSPAAVSVRPWPPMTRRKISPTRPALQRPGGCSVPADAAPPNTRMDPYNPTLAASTNATPEKIPGRTVR